MLKTVEFNLPKDLNDCFSCIALNWQQKWLLSPIWNKIYVFVLAGNVRKCVYEIVNMQL